jgi:hypothetical protein
MGARFLYLVFLLSTLAVAADVCTEKGTGIRSDKTKCEAAGCTWNGDFCLPSAEASAPGGIHSRAGILMTSKREAGMASKTWCKKQGTAKFSGVFGDGYVSRPKC